MEEEDKVVVQLLKNEDIRHFYETELRSLELAAFSVVLSALRAQGGLTEKRKETIGAIKIALNISDERQRAEIRRVAADERLCRIAERVVGDSGCLDWNTAGYNEYPLFPHFLQYPAGSRKRRSVAVAPRTPATRATPAAVKVEEISEPPSPDMIEEPYDPEMDGDYNIIKNGCSSSSEESEPEIVTAERVDRDGSDTEELKVANARAAVLAAAIARRKKKKGTLSPKIRNNQTSPDITAGSHSHDESYSPAKIRKPYVSPILARGRKRKFAPPVKAVGRKISSIPDGHVLNSSTSPESSYASISALASKLGISRGPGRGRGAKMVSTRGSGRGRGRGRKLPLSPRTKQITKIGEPGDPVSGDTEMEVEENQTPKQRKIKPPKEGKPKKEVVRRKKKKMNEENTGGEINMDGSDDHYREPQIGAIIDRGAGAQRSSFDDMGIDINLQCHESISSPNPQPTMNDDDSSSLVNNNLEHFGNYEADSRSGSYAGGSAQRQVPPIPPVPVKPPRARAKSEVPAKMRHKASKHLFNHDDTNRQPNFQQSETSYRSYNNTPLIYAPPINSVSPFANNFYNEMQMPIPPPGVNPPVGIRPRINPSTSSNSNFGYSTGIFPTSIQLARSPSRNPLPTPIFSTTLNANSLHKKRTQVLLPSTYGAQGVVPPGDVGIDGVSTTASSLAVAARNRSTLFDTQRQSLGLGLNSVRPTGLTPGVPVQRKAQPHILSSSKHHRALPTPPPVVFTSTTPPSTPGVTNNMTFNQSVATSCVEVGSLPQGITTTANTIPVVSATTNLVQVHTGNCGNENPSSTAPTPVQNIQTSIQNFQTANLGTTGIAVSNSTVLTGLPAGLNVNVVRSQGGQNIIFVQKSSAPIGGSPGTMPVVSQINQGTTLPPGNTPVQLPGRNTSRAVILRRGNISRPGSVMFVDVQKNQLLGQGQVPQLLQTARLITSSSDLTMLNMPTIVASSAGTVNMTGRKLVQTSAGTVTADMLHYTTMSPSKMSAVIDASLLKPSAQFRTVQQQQLSQTKGVQVLTAHAPTSVYVNQDNSTLPINYVTKLPTAIPALRPIITATAQQLQSIPSSILVSAPQGTEHPNVSPSMNLVQFENDIIHEEEVNTSAFIEYSSPRSNNVSKPCTSDPPTPNNNNWNLMNTPSGSSSTDTASESESFTSPNQSRIVKPGLQYTTAPPRHDDGIPRHSLAGMTIHESLSDSTDIFQTALKSSGIDFTPMSMNASRAVDDQIAESTNNPTSKSESHHSTMQLIVTSDSSKPVKWSE